MTPIKEVIKKEIKSFYSYPFELTENGLYNITIRASCKPGWKNKWWLKFKGFLEDIINLHLDDDDLRVEIDSLTFGKPNGKKGLFNSPAAFSGTKTLGKIKTVVFIAELRKGNHRIKFVSQRSAYLEDITIEKSLNPEKVEFYPEVKAEDENYYSWYSFVLVEQTLKSFSINAQAGVSAPGKDDDDLKIVIDGEVRKNPLSSHKDSYFCGFSLKGKEHSYTEDPNFKIGTHYIELFADKTPTLHSVKFTLDPSEFKVSKTDIRIYRPGPKGEDYNRFDEDINDAVAFWNRDFLPQNYPPPKPLDPNLVKAMIYVESEVGYGSSSGHSAYPDVMQVGNANDPAIHTLRNDGWVHPQTGKTARESEWLGGQVKVLEYSEANADSPRESIKWGVRWLYHKAQGILKDGGRYWNSWEEAVKEYNGGGDLNYQKKVLKIYKEGVDVRGRRLFLLLLIVTVFLTLLSTKIRPTNLPVFSPKGVTLGKAVGSSRELKIHRSDRLDSENSLAFVYYENYPAVGLSVIDNSDSIKYFLEGGELKETAPYGEIKGPGEYVKWMEVGDFDGDKKKEIVVQYIVSGTGLFHPFYVYKEKDNSFRLLLKRNDGVSEAQLTDLNNDGKKEILYAYSVDATGAGPRAWSVWKEVWGWKEGELELASHKFPSVYKNLILFYDHLLADPDPDSWLKSYYPMIECLKARANTNVSGTLAEVKTCRDL